MLQTREHPRPTAHPGLPPGTFLVGETILECDAQAAALWGCDRRSLLGRKPAALAPTPQPDGTPSDIAWRQRAEAARAGLAQSFEWRLRRSDGMEAAVLVTLEATDAHGPGVLQGRARPLPTEPGAMAAGRDNEALLRQILDNTTAVVFVKDTDGRYCLINREFQRLFGPRESEVVGRRDEDIFPPDLARLFRAHDHQVLQTAKPMEFEETLDVDGEERVYIALKFPMTDSAGTPVAICGIATDITERKRTEETLRHVALSVSGAVGPAIFEELVCSLALTLGVDFAFIGELEPGSCAHIKTRSVYFRGRIEANMEYDLAGTPCAAVVGREFHLIPDGLQGRYPNSDMLEALELEMYAGYPLFDSQGEPLGLIAIGHNQSLSDPGLAEAALKIFSVRAAAEIERSRAEAARQVSEASYQAIFEAAEDAIFIHDLDTGAIVDVNRKACEAYGYTHNELLQVNVGDLGSGEEPYTTEQAMRFLEQAKRGVPVYTEWHRRNKDGSLHWDEVYLKRIAIAGVDRIVVFTREITERKQAEEALRASEAQYRTIFNASVDGFLLMSTDGRVVEANPAFLAMHGYNRQELIGADSRRVVAPESYDLYAQMLQGVVMGRRFHAEARSLHRDGHAFDVDVHGVQVHHQGRPHVLAIVRDITERKQREDDLRKSEDRLRATVEAALDCIVSMDSHGRITGFNPAAEHTFGFAREAVLGQPLADLIIPERYRDAHWQGLARFRETGRSPFLGARIELTAMRADGSEFPVELAIDVAEGPEGPIFIGYLRDITTRRQAEAERSRLEAQLRQAQKMEAIGHLTGGVAHDFNNILTGILGYVTMAQDRLRPGDDQKLDRYLERAQRAGQRARDLIQQMLTFSRGQRGEPRPLALGPLIEESVKLLGSTLPSSMELHTVVARDVLLVSLDPIQVEQVLMNLCINARDAMTGSGVVEVSLRHAEHHGAICASCRKPVEGHFVEAAVRDTGPGLPPEHLDRIFEPFFTTKEVGKGSGMGLAMVHGIVHEYDGHILVDTAPGAGATFRVLFRPLAASRTAGDMEPDPTAANASTGLVLTGRIMLVDDDEVAGGFMQDLLEEWGLTVTAFRDAIQAHGHFTQNPGAFDLAILDQTMPRMTGFELARHLLAIRPDFPVILYTGYSESLSEERIIDAGIRALVRKPVDTDALCTLLKDLLADQPA